MTEMISNMIFRELSNKFSVLNLRCAGAEIDGGVFKHPPISSRLENPEAQQGAGP